MLSSSESASRPQLQRRQAAELTRTFSHPYAALGLLHNPFGELTHEERAEVAVVDSKACIDWLETASDRPRALQFTGDCGRGKTTHLLAIHHAWAESQYVYLPQWAYFPGHPAPVVPNGTRVLVDEVERLRGPRRWRLLRRRPTLVVATHRDLRRVLGRFGYDAKTVAVDGAMDAARVCKVVNRRIEFARLESTRRGDERARLSFSVDDAQTLVDRFGSDIRAMEHHLYEQVEHIATRIRDDSSLKSRHGQMRLID